MERLTNFFQDKKVKKVLDVGTGTGDFLVVIKEAFPNAKVTATDPNSESMQEAKERFPEVTFQEMSAENLEFPDNAFDAVTISMALHHLPNTSKALNELQRVVKPGGWIVVNELFSDNLNPAQEVHKMYHHFASQTDRIRGVSHNKTFKKEEIVRLVKESGIDIHLSFEFGREVNLIANTNELNERVEKMKAKLETVKDRPEYEALKPKIEEFRLKAAKYGFQPATRIVLVGQK